MIDWSTTTPPPSAARPAIDEAITNLGVFEIRVLEGERTGESAQITRAFRSWSHPYDGEHFVHCWDEDLGLGFYWEGDDHDGGVWVQYDLDARCNALPRYDERGTRRGDNESGDLAATPFGTDPTAALNARPAP